MNIHTHAHAQTALDPHGKQVSSSPAHTHTHNVSNMSHKHLETGLCAAAEIPIILCSE